MRNMKKDQVKSAAQTKANLCKASIWDRVAMITKIQKYPIIKLYRNKNAIKK